MKKYKISYENLVLNTILDTMKREQRRTIDEKDVSIYLSVLSKISHDNNIDLDVDFSQENKKSKEKIEKYAYIKDDKNLGITFTLYPWIDEKDLTRSLENTIFVNMEPVCVITSEKLKFTRSSLEKSRLKELESKLEDYFIDLTRSNILAFEVQKQFEEKRLEKIGKTLNIKLR